jgi:AcrR family transcriptional regulator
VPPKHQPARGSHRANDPDDTLTNDPDDTLTNDPDDTLTNDPDDTLTNDPDDTRQRILTVAQHQFSHTGYRGTSVKSVATGAGVTTGAVYHYFGSKAEMYSNIGTDVVGGILGAYEALLATLPAELNQRERIDALFQTNEEQLSANSDQARNGIAVELDAARYEVAAAARDKWARELNEVYRLATGEPIDTRDGDWWDFTKSTLLVEILILGIARYVLLHGTDDLGVVTRGVRRLIFANLETAEPSARRS